MKLVSFVVFIATIQFIDALSIEDIVLDKVLDYLDNLCPAVQLADELNNFENCVQNVGASPLSSPSQLCNSWNRYVDCSKPLLASLKSCNQNNANDAIYVLDSVTAVIKYFCENGGQRLTDFLNENGNTCFGSNYATCSLPLSLALQPHLDGNQDSSTLFTTQNCEILKNAMDCTANKSCFQPKSAAIFKGASDIVYANTCLRDSTSAATSSGATFISMIFGLIVTASRLMNVV